MEKKVKKMNIVDKLHQKFVIDKIKDTDWSKGTSGPLIIELDTTEACDLACIGCVSEEIMVSKNRFSDDRLIELGREFSDIGVKGVVLIGGGEPLAHPKVGEFMTYLGENDISLGLTTNGTFIHKYLDIIAEYSSWTRVSVDAATDSMFQKLRPTKGGGSKFDLIIENMRKLAKVKKGKLGFSFLIRTESEGFGMVTNIDEIYDAAKLAKEIGCDYFEVKPSYQYRNNAIHSLTIHPQEDMQRAREQIDKLEELVSEDFAIIQAITLEASLNRAQEKQDKEYTTCPATELRTLVTPSGVYVCPYWRGKSQYNVGNVATTSLKDVWNSQRRQDVQAWLDPSKHCQFHCLRDNTNKEVFKIISQINDKKEIKIVEEFDRFI